LLASNPVEYEGDPVIRTASPWTLALAALLLASAPAFAETKTVVIQFLHFKPATIDVKPGDEVEFVNKDVLEHTATASNGAFDSKAIKAGGSWKWKAGDPGQYAYTCAFHNGMKGVINVKP
jgi:plastocyanin